MCTRGKGLIWGRKFLVVLAASSFALSVAANAHATVLYWDADGVAVPPNGGVGSWSITSSTNSWYNYATSSYSAWTNDSSGSYDAYFDGTSGAVTIASAITVHNMTFNVGGYSLSSGNAITLVGTTPTVTTNAGTTTIASILAGSAGLIKDGSGMLTLSGANTFTGGLTVKAGTLTVSSIAASSVAQPSGKGNITLAGGTFQYLTSASTGIYIGADQTFALAADTTSAINLNSGYSGAADGMGGFSTTGGLSGSGNLIVNSNGANTGVRIIFKGANTFTGCVTVSSGVLQFGYTATDTTLGNNATLTVNGGELRIGTATQIVGSFTANLGALAGVGGYVNAADGMSSGTTTLSVGGANTNTTYAGVIRNNPNSGSRIFALTKVGSGQLTLSGANTYTGLTTVSAGTLNVTGSLKTSGIYVASAGTAFSSGYATLIESLATGGSLSSTIVGSDFSTATGGTVSSVSAASSISMSWRNRTSAETSQLISDVVNVADSVASGSYTLTLTYDVATLTARGFSASAAGDIYIAYWDGTAWKALTSTVNTANDTASAVVGNSLVAGGVTQFAVVPEPSALAMLTTALFGIAAYAWRKRK